MGEQLVELGPELSRQGRGCTATPRQDHGVVMLVAWGEEAHTATLSRGLLGTALLGHQLHYASGGVISHCCIMGKKRCTGEKIDPPPARQEGPQALGPPPKKKSTNNVGWDPLEVTPPPSFPDSI